MRIRLIAVDLDGTLLGGTEGRYGFLLDGLATLRCVASLEANIAIVTGRDIDFVCKLMEREDVQWTKEGWPHLIIAEECYIYRLRNGQYEPDLEWNTTIRLAERFHFKAIRTGVDEMIAGDLAEIDAGLYRRKGEIEQMRGYVEVRFADPSCAQAGERVLAAWLEQHELPYVTIRNWADIYIRHSTVGKGALLYKVCMEMNISSSEVLAIGDSCNDLSMLDGRLGFIGAAPGNAEDEVKQAIKKRNGYVATAHYGKGVAEIIDHYTLQNKPKM